MDVSALNLGMIAAYYNISCTYILLPLALLLLIYVPDDFVHAQHGTLRSPGTCL
jgi:hypothetical protein